MLPVIAQAGLTGIPGLIGWWLIAALVIGACVGIVILLTRSFGWTIPPQVVKFFWVLIEILGIVLLVTIGSIAIRYLLGFL